MDYSNLTLRQIYDEADAIARDARTRFDALTAQQLNWKPSAQAWSVAQCLDHLMVINREYYPTFDRVLEDRYPRSLLHRLPGAPAFFGRLMVKSLSPGSTRKLKAPGTAQPSSSTLDANIVERFVDHQRDLLARMKRLEAKDPERLVITSPFARAIVYSLLDAFRLIVAHERRHFAQAERVVATEGFPRG
jgi:hypothetical protein